METEKLVFLPSDRVEHSISLLTDMGYSVNIVSVPHKFAVITITKEGLEEPIVLKSKCIDTSLMNAFKTLIIK